MFRWLVTAASLWLACFQFHAHSQTLAPNARAQIICVENSGATSTYQANAEVVQAMVDCGLTNFTGKPDINAAWRSLVSTQDVVGIKVFSEPGLTGTRPAVVAAVVLGLLHA